MTTLAVVTPWHNAHALLPDYIAAIEAAPPDELIVVDNGSDPRLPPLSTKQIRWPENRGFTRACNAGLDAATTDAVLFLNNDVKMAGAPSDWLSPIRLSLRPGLLVGALLRTDPHGDVDGRPHAYLDGWCFAGMRADLLALGGFDELYDEPAYYSDNDLCLRARRAGMRLAQVSVPLIHLENYTNRRTIDPKHLERVTMANRERFAALERAA